MDDQQGLNHSTWDSVMLCASLDGRERFGKMDTCMFMAESPTVH